MSSLDLQATLSTEQDEKCVAGKDACVLLFIWEKTLWANNQKLEDSESEFWCFGY